MTAIFDTHAVDSFQQEGGGALDIIITFFLSVQPFAYVVGNYTCRNGDKKRCKNIHANTPPFSTGLGRGSMAMIT